MDDDALMRLAEGKRARLRNLMQGWRDHLSAVGRRYSKLDVAIYSSYGGECVLREIAAGPHGDKTVLKGGTLFRIWDGLDARPTMDLDLQAIDPAVPGTVLRDWLLDTICSEAFSASTGLVCLRDNLKISVIKEGRLPEAWRIEGDVTLGPPVFEPTVVRLCVEATWGVPPQDAYTETAVAGMLPKEAPLRLLGARPEWMAAEKLHSLVSRGKENSRLKDFYDLAVLLLPRRGLDIALLGRCLEHVFKVEFHGADLWPETADMAIAFMADYADENRSRLWVEGRWPDLVGRAWVPGRDPTLGQACEGIAASLERLGLLALCPAAKAAEAWKHLVEASAAGHVRDACASLGALIRLTSGKGGVAPERLRDRIWAASRLDGAWIDDPQAVLTAAVETLSRGPGFAAVEAAAREAGLSLDKTALRIVAAPQLYASISRKGFQPSAPRDRSVTAVPQERLDKAAVNLASGTANLWLIGVATLAEAQAAGQDVSGIDIPAPPNAKVAKGWEGVARRNGFETNLDAMLATLRRPAPGMGAGRQPGLR